MCLYVYMNYFPAIFFKMYLFYNFLGIGLVCISVIADAFLPNFQERVFEHGSSRIEVTYFTNILCLFAMTTSFSATGNEKWILDDLFEILNI